MEHERSRAIPVGIIAFGLLIAIATGNSVGGALLGVGIMLMGAALYQWG